MTKISILTVLGLLCLAFLATIALLMVYPIAGTHTDTLIEVAGGGFVTSLVTTVVLWLGGP